MSLFVTMFNPVYGQRFVQQVVPEQNATSVQTTAGIQISFNTEINAATLSDTYELTSEGIFEKVMIDVWQE